MPQRRLGIYFHGVNGTMYCNYGMYKVVPEGDRMKGREAAEAVDRRRRPATSGEWLDCIKTRKQPSCSVDYHVQGRRAAGAGQPLAAAGPLDPLRPGRPRRSSATKRPPGWPSPSTAPRGSSRRSTWRRKNKASVCSANADTVFRRRPLRSVASLNRSRWFATESIRRFSSPRCECFGRKAKRRNCALGRSVKYVGSLLECPKCGRFLLQKPGADEPVVHLREEKSRRKKAKPT